MLRYMFWVEAVFRFRGVIYDGLPHSHGQLTVVYGGLLSGEPLHTV